MENNSKDKQIIRQSQMKAALDYFQMCGACPTISDLIKVTTMLENFIVNGYKTADLPNYEKLDEYIQSQYKGK
jgi:hypothetical protein